VALPSALAYVEKYEDDSPSDQSVDELKSMFLKLKSGPPSVSTDMDALSITAVKDYTMLATTSKRAGKKDVEALAYLSLGLVYENQNKLRQVFN